jgi:pyridoxine kinase
MSKQILLINDMAGYGKVATAAMLPILSYMGLPVYNLPTALVSNTLDYGKFEILDTTDYMEKTLAVWDELGFAFDAVATGFITNARQAQLIANFCGRQQERGVPVFVDPIMGDEGHLYNGIELDAVPSIADFIDIGISAVMVDTTLLDKKGTSDAVGRAVRARNLAASEHRSVGKRPNTTTGHLFRGVS